MRVRIVLRKNGTSLIEWVENDDTLRGWIPDVKVSAISGNAGDVENPRMAVPYTGTPWRELVSMAATSISLERELRRRGIWTISDLRANPNVALSAIQSVYGIDLAQLLYAAAEFEKG